MAERLRLTREAKGLNKTTFARRAGLHPNLYGLFERGKRPLTIGAANQLANAHNISLDWLYRGNMDSLPQDLADKIAKLRFKK